MITLQIVSSKNSARYLFCPKKGYRNENMKRNKRLFESPAFTVFYQKYIKKINE